MTHGTRTTVAFLAGLAIGLSALLHGVPLTLAIGVIFPVASVAIEAMLMARLGARMIRLLSVLSHGRRQWRATRPTAAFLGDMFALGCAADLAQRGLEWIGLGGHAAGWLVSVLVLFPAVIIVARYVWEK